MRICFVWRDQLLTVLLCLLLIILRRWRLNKGWRALFEALLSVRYYTCIDTGGGVVAVPFLGFELDSFGFGVPLGLACTSGILSMQSCSSGSTGT